MGTSRDQLGQFPSMLDEPGNGAPRRPNSRSDKPNHALARNILLVIAGLLLVGAIHDGGADGAIGLLILAGFYALGYHFRNRWLIGGLPLLGAAGYATFLGWVRTVEHGRGYDGWDLLGYFLLFAGVAIVVFTVWLAVVGALVTRGDRRGFQAASANMPQPSTW